MVRATLCSTVLLLLLIQFSNSARILIICPTPAYSHQQPFLVLGNALAKKGHDVTMVTSNPTKAPMPNYHEVDISFLYQYMHENMKKHMGFSLQQRMTAFDLVKNFNGFMEFVSEKILESNTFKEFIKQVSGTQFDLVIYEAIGFSSFLGITDLIGNPPVIGLNTIQLICSVDSELGNPVIPSYVPSVLLPYNDQMTFWERATNLAANLYLQLHFELYIKPAQERLMRKYFGNLKYTAEERDRNKSLLLVSADLATTYPKPIQPNTVYVGPLHVHDKDNTSQHLPEDLKKWMDEAEDGVIYFSLGSNMKGTSVDPEKRAAFIKAFSQFPKVRVLWKWESDERLPGQTDNVLTKKWIPQKAVLAHPKLRFFISQCGLQSLQEALSRGVPILGVPVFGDQDYNAKKIVSSGAGVTIEFTDVTYDTLCENIKALLTNPSFKKNAKRSELITKDKPMPPVETAVWWVEYVLRHQGAPHLRPASLDLTWYQYFLLDVIGAFLLALSLAVYIIYYVMRTIVVNFVTRNKVKTS